MTKWYADCVASNGDVGIVYWLRLGWGAFAATFVSTLLHRGGTLVTGSRLTRADAPRVNGDRLVWQTEALHLEMHRRAPAVSTSMLNGTVQWRCELPSAEATLRVGDATISGTGYAEVLRLTGAPWTLPIDELRWGRFTGQESSVVWIDWRGAHPLTYVTHDGQRAEGCTVDDGRVGFDGISLTLDDQVVIRDAPLRDTLDEVPLLRHVVPRRLAAMTECKWRSRGTIHRGDDAVDHGWCISEVVRFA